MNKYKNSKIYCIYPKKDKYEENDVYYGSTCNMELRWLSHQNIHNYKLKKRICKR